MEAVVFEQTPQKYEDSASANVIIHQNSSPNMSRLYSWLRQSHYVTESGNPDSTVADVQLHKPYAIPPEGFAELTRHLEACRKEGKVLHFTERQYTSSVTHSGIMLDFDIYQPIPATQISDKVAYRIFSVVVDALRQILYIPDGTTFAIYMISKPAPVQIGDRYKDGVHILVPAIQITKQVKSILFDTLAKSKALADTFGRMILSEDCRWPKPFDMNAKAAPVFFFGSCKKDSEVAYTLKYAASYEIDGVVSQCFIDVEKFAETRNMVAELSLTYSNELTAKKSHFDHAEALDTVVNSMHVEEAPAALTEEEELQALLLSSVNAKGLYNILEILTEDYCRDYDKWRNVLFAIAHTSRDYEIIARWFSKRFGGQYYDERGFNKVWRAALYAPSTTPLTMRSIHYWAQRCSPVKYHAVRSANHVEVAKAHVMKHDGLINHYVAAQILYQLSMHQFMVDVMPSKTGRLTYVWYEFVSDAANSREGGIYKWREELCPDTLHKKLPVEVDEVFGEVYRFLRDAISETPDKNLANWYKEVMKNVKRGRYNLGENGFQTGVIAQAKFMFRNRRLYDELDKHPNFLGCGNGVLEIGREPKLYASYHEILISKFTKTRYVEFSRENPCVCDLLQMMRDIYIEPDVFMFMMFFYSTALSGDIKAPIMLMTFAGGQNGKTTAAVLTRETLGEDYSSGLKPPLLTGTAERAEAANEAVMAMKGRRFCYFDEFNESDALNPARMKSIANPAKQDSRGNYEKQQGFANTATIQVISNYPLNCDTQDHGTWRRILAYSNKVKFCPSPDPNNPYEKQENVDVIQKWPSSPEYKSAWLSILVYFYSRLQHQYGGDISRVPRPTIDHETQTYRNSQDMVNCFITHSLYHSPSSDPIPLDTLITRYREWFSSRHRRQAPLHTTLVGLFKSSRIAKFIAKAGGIDDIVKEIRIRGPDDRLGPDEASFLVEAPAYNIKALPDKFRFEDFNM